MGVGGEIKWNVLFAENILKEHIMHKSFVLMIAELRQQENEKKETGLIQKLEKE